MNNDWIFNRDNNQKQDPKAKTYINRLNINDAFYRKSQNHLVQVLPNVT